MKVVLGFLGIVLAGSTVLTSCTVQPPRSGIAPTGTQTSTPTGSATDSQQQDLAAAPFAASVLRIGIEHLAPEPGQGEPERARVESVGGGRTGPRQRSEPAPARTIDQRSLLDLAGIDLDQVADPMAREALRFCDDLVQADRRRVRREVGLPFFGWQGQDNSRGALLHAEEQLAADQAEWLQENGMLLLRRPLQLMLRRLPVVEQFEFELADFRSDHVPLSEPYRIVHGDRRRLGRLSMRLHAGDLEDPLELVWIHNLVRIGTSQQAGKIAFDWSILPQLQLALRARTEYDTGDFGLRGDLTYRASDFTSLHLAFGDDMDFLSSSSLYSLFETPMDGAPGLVLYAVHIF